MQLGKKNNKIHPDWKGKSNILFAEDCLCRKYGGIYKKAFRTNK